MIKQCAKCKTEKELSEFHSDNQNKDGLQSYCISCKKIDKEKRKTTVPWVRYREYAIRRCTDESYRYYNYYGGKGIKCRLTKAEVKEIWERDKGFELKRPSLDRIDPDRDYNKENCRFIELGENIGRGKRKQKEEVVPF